MKTSYAPISTADQLGTLLHSARKLRQLTQTALASRVGLSQARLSALELQPGAISVDQLLALCAQLGLELYVQPRPPASDVAAEPSPASDW